MKNWKKIGLSCQLSLSQTYGFQYIYIYKAKVTFLSYKTMLPPKHLCKQQYSRSSRLFNVVFRHVFEIIDNIHMETLMKFESGGEVNLICEYYMHGYFCNIRLNLIHFILVFDTCNTWWKETRSLKTFSVNILSFW